MNNLYPIAKSMPSKTLIIKMEEVIRNTICTHHHLCVFFFPTPPKKGGRKKEKIRRMTILTKDTNTNYRNTHKI